MVLRPHGVVIDGSLEVGLEILVGDGAIQDIRPHTGIPERWVASVPFVNAHSHLEYRGFQGSFERLDYWPWIREITRRKADQTPAQVEADCQLAARENHASGVAFIGEHSDRPGSAAALSDAGIDGFLFQEVITFNEALDPAEKLRV